MPELPEVEAARVLVESNCKGHKIQKAIAFDDTKVIEGIAPDELEKVLTGRKLLHARRKGKQMWMELDGEAPALMFHFGMTGFCAIQGVPIIEYVNAKSRTDEWPPKYWKLILEFEGGLKLAYCDARRFGKIRLQEDPENNEPVSKLGFDPVLEMVDIEEFRQKLAAQRRAIKTVILDQSFSAGVGNWVADEILYQARIHPEQKAASLSEEQSGALHEQMQVVLKTAVEAGADSSRYPDTWIFHQKWESRGKGPKPQLDGKPIEYIKVGGRTSAFVPALQKIPPGTAKAAAAGSSGKGKGSKQKVAEEGAAAKAAAPKQSRRVASKPAAEEATAPEDQPDEEVKEEGIAEVGKAKARDARKRRVAKRKATKEEEVEDIGADAEGEEADGEEVGPKEAPGKRRGKGKRKTKRSA
ncbi:g1404 [Coccomyxa viridis]|uniref:G1404 protein n=1 Tax=Coccomyxa viridis TaxID=1274662 RepID=A0ABP1FHY0_9CHLO